MPAVNEAAIKGKPLYWLVLLDQAVEVGNFEAAAEAQRELARLGVRVSYGRPKAQRQEECHVA
jgi:hypothetical protein